MPNIFLAPRANETSYKNFLSTIENGVEYSLVEPHLNPEGKSRLADQSKLFVWGNKASIKASWEKMDEGDLVLFYRGREGNEKEGKFLYAGTVLFKQESEQLGLALWPPKPGEKPWTCVFFLENLRPIYIPVSQVSEMAGYAPNFVVQGFIPLHKKGVSEIVKRYGSIEAFVSNFPPGAKRSDSELEESESQNKVSAHSEAQMLLLKTGKTLGFDTYSPDKSKEAYGEPLSNYITLDSFPKTYIGEEIVPVAKQIDVIWFLDNVPICAFEVEHTTGIESGMHRLYQLHPLSTRLFVVSSRKNEQLFNKYVSGAPYHREKDRYVFRDYKQLEDYFNEISKLRTASDVFLGVGIRQPLAV